MTKQRFKELKNLLTRGNNYYGMQKHFLDHFADAPELLAGSQPTDEELEMLLEASLVGAVRYMTGRTEVSTVRMLKLPEHGLVHGSFQSGGRMGTFFYIEGVRTGLASLAGSSGQCHLARFRTTILTHAPCFN